jgi:colanic acid biosynthesis glycosyl transferase WcaI
MSKNSTITIITGNYYPEDTAIGLYTTQFAKHLSEKGNMVKIITGFPSYPQWKIYNAYKTKPSFFVEHIDGIEIIRYKQYVPNKVNFKGRVLMMLSLFYGTLRNISKIKNTDLVICIVPYTISILPAILLSKRKKAKLWIHVQDFEFDLAIDSGIVKNNSLFMKAIKSILSNFEKRLLNAANVVSSISFSMLENIKKKSSNTAPYYFPNWVSSVKINPEICTNHSFVDTSLFTLLYSGNIGEKQDWQFLENLCELINPNEGIAILIVGDGGYKKTLIKQLERFPFVKFHDPVPYEELNDLLCSSNIHFLFQKTEVVDTIMPSKILGMMASAKPSIITGNENSEVATIIKQSEGGYYYANNDPFSVYQTVLKLKNDSSLSKKIGENARAFILNKFSENQILLDFTLKINQVLS